MATESLHHRTNLEECDQGDFVLCKDTTFTVLSLSEDKELSITTVNQPTVGLAIITQICDLQAREGRDYIKVASIVDRTSAELDGPNKRIKDDYDPRYANIENLPDGHFVDLDHVMLVDRKWLAEQTVFVGFDNKTLLRSFQRQLGRNLARFGFPDNFNSAMKKVSDKLRRTKRRPNGLVGLLAAKVKEILVYCDEQWDEGEGNLRFVLILETDFIQDIEEIETEFSQILESNFIEDKTYLLDRRDGEINIVCETEETISLLEYRKGRRLDLGFVSYASDDPDV